ncbi:MAG: class I SAM-dependent methyltransferase [Candidatus Aenigmatarchaeota archaeon]
MKSEFDSIAKYYDMFHKGNEGDLKFYQKEASKSSTVLDVGCGTGRLAIPIAKKGIKVVGIDMSKKMIDIARNKAKADGLGNKVKFLQRDMKKFNLRKKFDLIIIANRSFLNAVTDKDQKNTLLCCKRHLKKGGRLIFNIFVPDCKIISQQNSKEELLKTFFDKKNKETIKLYYKSRIDRLNQISYSEYIIKKIKNNRKIYEKRNRITLRYCFFTEIKYLLELCGFKVKNVYGDFNRHRINEKSREMIWIVNRK